MKYKITGEFDTEAKAITGTIEEIPGTGPQPVPRPGVPYITSVTPLVVNPMTVVDFIVIGGEFAEFASVNLTRADGQIFLGTATITSRSATELRGTIGISALEPGTIQLSVNQNTPYEVIRSAYVDIMVEAAIPQPGVYTCPTCGAVFDSPDELYSHQITAHPAAPQSLYITSVTPLTAKSLSTTEFTIVGGGFTEQARVDFSMDEGRIFLGSATILSQSATEIKCNMGFGDLQTGLVQVCVNQSTPYEVIHTAYVDIAIEGTPLPVFRCTICDAEFPTQLELNQHRETVHPGAPIPTPPEGYVVNDLTFYPIYDVPKPAKGETIIDPTFHLPITRITDALVEVPHPYGARCHPGYPKHDIENADGTLLLIQSYGGHGWLIYEAQPPYQIVQDIVYQPGDTGAAIDCRWDTVDPDIMYYNYGGIIRFNVRTGEKQMLIRWSEFFPTTATAHWNGSLDEEGDFSDDRRFMAFAVRGMDSTLPDPWSVPAKYAVFDRDGNGPLQPKLISLLEAGDPNVWHVTNFIGTSHSGRYVLGGEPSQAWPIDFSRRIPVDIVSGHCHVGYSKEGREVMVGAVWGYLNGVESKWMGMCDLETGEKTFLHPFGNCRSYYHVSCNNSLKPGWALFSTYYPAYPTPMTSWDENSLLMVELTTRVNPPPRCWRVAHTRCHNNGYAGVSFGKLNRKGTKIWFSSSWGYDKLFPANAVDVYQIDLPATWHEDLG